MRETQDDLRNAKHSSESYSFSLASMEPVKRLGRNAQEGRGDAGTEPKACNQAPSEERLDAGGRREAFGEDVQAEMPTDHVAET